MKIGYLVSASLLTLCWAIAPQGSFVKTTQAASVDDDISWLNLLGVTQDDGREQAATKNSSKPRQSAKELRWAERQFNNILLSESEAERARKLAVQAEKKAKEYVAAAQYETYSALRAKNEATAQENLAHQVERKTLESELEKARRLERDLRAEIEALKKRLKSSPRPARSSRAATDLDIQLSTDEMSSPVLAPGASRKSRPVRKADSMGSSTVRRSHSKRGDDSVQPLNENAVYGSSTSPQPNAMKPHEPPAPQKPPSAGIRSSARRSSSSWRSDNMPAPRPRWLSTGAISDDSGHRRNPARTLSGAYTDPETGRLIGGDVEPQITHDHGVSSSPVYADPIDSILDEISALRKQSIRMRRRGRLDEASRIWKRSDKIELEMKRQIEGETPVGSKARYRNSAYESPISRISHAARSGDELRRDVERLRYEVEEIRTMLRAALRKRGSNSFKRSP